MKQNQVIAELSEYMENNPADAESVGKVIQYLDACCHLFEKGILSHQKITNKESSVLLNKLCQLDTPSSLAGLTMPGKKVCTTTCTCLVGFSE